ncbi:hypothetical protein GCM10022219_03860 [Microbacterium oryzae]
MHHVLPQERHPRARRDRVVRDEHRGDARRHRGDRHPLRRPPARGERVAERRDGRGLHAVGGDDVQRRRRGLAAQRRGDATEERAQLALGDAERGREPRLLLVEAVDETREQPLLPEGRPLDADGALEPELKRRDVPPQREACRVEREMRHSAIVLPRSVRRGGCPQATGW